MSADNHNKIGGATFTRSSLDMYASLNILHRAICDYFQVGEVQPLFLDLQLADGSFQQPHWIVDNGYFLVEFILIDVVITKEVNLGHFEPFIRLLHIRDKERSNCMLVNIRQK